MKSQTSNQMEESIYQDLLEKEAIFWLRFARKSIIALLIFFFFFTFTFCLVLSQKRK